MTAATTRNLNTYRAALTAELGDYLRARCRAHTLDTHAGTATTTLNDYDGEPLATVVAHAASGSRIRLTYVGTDFSDLTRNTTAAALAAHHLRRAWEDRPR